MQAEGSGFESRLLHQIRKGREFMFIRIFPGSDRNLTSKQLESAAAKVIKSALDKGPINNPPISGRVKTKLDTDNVL